MSAQAQKSPEISENSVEFFDQDPFESSKSNSPTDPSLGLEEDPFATSPEKSEPSPGFEEDPFTKQPASNTPPLLPKPDLPEDKNQSPSVSKDTGLAGTPTEYTPRFSFSHKYRVLGGFTETHGLISIENQDFIIKELRLITSYQQTIRIRTSANFYNYVRINVTFAQNYDTHNQQYVDNQSALREIYFNYQFDEHQIRAGSQVFRLGKVDFDSVIDNLNPTNFNILNTLDPDSGKKSLTAIRYNWYKHKRSFTVYLDPLQQKTPGMEYTDFRDDSQKRERGERPDSKSFIRDYFGLQYEWLGHWDTRISFFHWFDTDNDISWEYIRNAQEDDQFLVGKNALTHFVETFYEKESISNFATLETDTTFGSYVWKFEAGLFDRKNFYHLNRLHSDYLIFDTVRVPYVASSTSIERLFSKLFLMGIVSYRHLFGVPEDTHILMFENYEAPLDQKRDLERFQMTGVLIWDMTSQWKVNLAGFQSTPFAVKGVMNNWIWNRQEYNSQWQIKLLHGETDEQKMLNKKIFSNQFFVVYQRVFTEL
ncbi:MAG: hypothetical protein HQM11_03105 [SAR324 cluster bacterium]|nr:hypothetical protein [SAR324 cluster bacterium]